MQGIYQIKNIKNGKVYIGSSINVEKRFNQHIRMLKNNKHHSTKLQRAYNKTKDKNIFEFTIIEEVLNSDELLTKEQYYIDLYNAYNNGYNCCEKVDNLQYTLKNQKKKNKQQEINKLFDEFISLYNPDIIHLGFTFKNRLLSKHYKVKVYTYVNSMIKWFFNNYDETYKCDINCTGDYFMTVINLDGQKTYYKYDGKDMVLSHI